LTDRRRRKQDLEIEKDIFTYACVEGGREEGREERGRSMVLRV
jgi:hypothetical protein